MKSLHVTRLGYVGPRFLVSLVVAVAIGLSPWSPAVRESTTVSAAEMPIGATLLVLAAPVEVQLAETDSFVAASDGQMLGLGDVVRTGPGGLALLTFFDGSESQLGAETEIQLERVDATPAPQIAFLQTAGVTMNHVVPMPPGGTFRTDTPAASGLVRGTSYVVVVGEDASAAPDDATAVGPDLLCGVGRDGSCATSVILLTDRDGHVGRVDVAALGDAAGAPLQLASAGAAAASVAGQTVGAQVALPTLEALEAAANARNLPSAVREAERHARNVAAAIVPLTKAASVDNQATDVVAPEPLAHGDSPSVAHSDAPLGPHGDSPYLVHSDTASVAQSDSPLAADSDAAAVGHTDDSAVAADADDSAVVADTDDSPSGAHADSPAVAGPVPAELAHALEQHDAAPVTPATPAGPAPVRPASDPDTTVRAVQATPTPVTVRVTAPVPPPPAPVVVHTLPVPSVPTVAQVKPTVRPTKPGDQNQP